MSDRWLGDDNIRNAFSVGTISGCNNDIQTDARTIAAMLVPSNAILYVYIDYVAVSTSSESIFDPS